jgi:hypothetical protein
VDASIGQAIYQNAKDVSKENSSIQQRMLAKLLVEVTRKFQPQCAEAATQVVYSNAQGLS